MLPRTNISFTVGNRLHTVKIEDVVPETTLNSFLRDRSHLTGTKRMCLEGGCGVCTVAVEEVVNGKRKVSSVNSCLVSIFSCHGWKIHTIEGIGNPLIGYHKIQKTLADNYGTQCGFCSPGMVMNMFSLVESGKTDKQQIENGFAGNLCRCTGYRPILKGFQTLSTDRDKEIPDIEELKICQKDPNKLCNNECSPKENFYLELGGNSNWIKVHALNDLLEVLKISVTTNYMLVSGNTARGVYKNDPIPSQYIDIRDVTELVSYEKNGNVLIVGGNVTLNDFIDICNQVATTDVKFDYLKTIVDHLYLVATVQIRNVGSLAGNLMMKHRRNEFPSDIFVLLETFNATLVIVDVDGNESFRSPQGFLSTDMTKKVIKQIIFNGLDASYKYSSYKIMPRAQNAHAMVNAGFLLKVENDVVKSAKIVYGGINPTFVHATNTETYLVGKIVCTNAVLQGALESLNGEITPDNVPPDPSPEYRKNLALSLFYKFVLKIAPSSSVGDRYKSGGKLLERPLSTGTQEYETHKDEWPLTEPIPKVESLPQSAGQIKYIIDMTPLPDEANAAYVTAKAKAGSKIIQVDTSEALALPGVICFCDKKDIPGRNTFTPLNATMLYTVEEEIFCSEEVKYYHQPIGLIVAETEEIALKAAELVVVKYAPPTRKVYLDVRDVIADNVTDRITHINTYLPKTKGNDIKKVVKGDFYIGGQYHFHMEVQCCKVVPTFDGGLDIYSTTQWMDSIQYGVATALNMRMNKINVKVARLGGAFGAKILRSGLMATGVAVATNKIKRPVKLVLPFEHNMNILGKRYPLYMKYEVGVNAAGVVQYLEADLYSDFGTGGNEPFEFLMSASFENCYDLSTWEFSTNAVRTDTYAHCYCRGPGTVEGTAAIDSIFEHVAHELKLDPIFVKLANVNHQTSPNIDSYYWTNLKTWATIENRKAEIEKFNQANRWTKRGMAIVPMRFKIDFLFNYSVLVSVFHGNGGVAISHGGIEMGQGIHTKVAQVCAYKFGIDLDRVSVKPSYNIITPNCPTTGGSLTSESVCYAVIQACDTLLARMKPIRDKMTNPTWEEVVNASFDNQIQLVATGYISNASKDIGTYNIFGICASSVEVDLLTGKHEILQVDIIEDLGKSMSPIIDVGQIEGAFVMGIGYYTTEELIYDAEGKLLTNRTWTYKPPGAKDIPINFRVKFAEKSDNPKGVLHSKAVAEPPLCLTVSVPLALRNALSSAREEVDPTKNSWIPFNGPTTVEKTFLYALNNYKQYVLK